MPRKKVFKKVYKRKRHILKNLFKILAVLAAFFLLCLTGLFVMFFKDLPRPEKFTEGIIVQSTKIYDRTGNVLLYEITGEEKRTFVGLSKIPEHLKQAIITAEDRKFYQHHGIDFKAIFRALLYDLKLGQPAQGASTISQQLIRSYFLTQHKTIKRKTREIILTLELERRYSKEQILEWYLNLIPFGSYLYGVEAASQAFFNKSVTDVALAESAVLAALIRAPSRLSPYGDQLDNLLQIKDYILGAMAEEGYITKEQAETAKAEEIKFSQPKNVFQAPHFSMYVKDYLEKKYGSNYLETSGLKVITTLDVNLQQKAEEIVKNKVAGLGIYNAHNAALVSIDPQTGEILAMVGSKDYFGTSAPEGCISGDNCQFDPNVNAALALRQPGSAFKPFAYAQALKTGFTPETLLWNVATEFNPNCSPSADETKDEYGLDCYHPQNYTGRFGGLTNFRKALAQSINLPSVKVLYLAGLRETLALAKALGLESLKDESHYGLALVLGGGEVKLLEMTAAYGVFAQEGKKYPLHFIKTVEDSSGKVIEEERPPEYIKVLPVQTARQINDILSDNEARAPLFGLNSALYIKGYDVAAKTGTTQEYKDGWAIGYSPNLVTGVWAGNNDNTSTLKPGVTLAGPIWHEFMVYGLSQLPKQNFTPPQPVVAEKIMVSGEEPEDPHCILHFVDKNDPQGDAPENPEKDTQYLNWEWAVRNYLSPVK